MTILNLGVTCEWCMGWEVSPDRERTVLDLLETA